jgi:hypothetical protein
MKAFFISLYSRCMYMVKKLIVFIKKKPVIIVSVNGVKHSLKNSIFVCRFVQVVPCLFVQYFH